MNSVGQAANGTTGGAILLDMIPIVVIVVLIIAFIIGRHRFKSEERHLNQVIDTINQQRADDSIDSGKDQK